MQDRSWTARKTPQAAAEAQRRAWVARSLPQDAEAAWAELRTTFEQSGRERTLLTSLVQLGRTCVSASAIPQPDSEPVGISFGDEVEV